MGGSGRFRDICQRRIGEGHEMFALRGGQRYPLVHRAPLCRWIPERRTFECECLLMMRAGELEHDRTAG